MSTLVSMSIFLIFLSRYDLIDTSCDAGMVCANLESSLPISVHGLAVRPGRGHASCPSS